MRIQGLLRYSFLAAIVAYAVIGISLTFLSDRLTEPMLSTVMKLAYSTSLALLGVSFVGGLTGYSQYRRETHIEKRQTLDPILYSLGIVLAILPIAGLGVLVLVEIVGLLNTTRWN